MTRNGRRWIDPCTREALDGVKGGEAAALLSILINNIQIFGRAAESAPPTFIAKTLVMRGAVAYDAVSGEWFAFNAVGETDRAGLPLRVKLILDGRGRMSPTMDVERDGLRIFPATPMFSAPAWEVIRRVDTLAYIQNAIGQNVDALRQIAAIVYNDQTLTASIQKAEADRAAGKSTTSVYAPMGSEVKLLNFSPDAKSNIPDLMEVYTQTIEELDAATGRATLGEKNERRITDEVTVIENAASSTIDVVIDTFNRYAKWYGVDAMAARGSEVRRSTVQPEAAGEVPPEDVSRETEGENAE